MTTSTNWNLLSEAQKDYFRHLSADTDYSAVEFFGRTVPPELQDDPAKLEVFLNGGTVVTEDWVPARGRAGGEYVRTEHEVSDKDWSHDTSVANGGSDDPSNGRWEDSSTNRARGSANTTAAEQQAADAEADFDVHVLERGTVLEEAEQAADLALAAEGAELLSVATEFTLDFLAPAVGGLAAARVASDQFEKTEHKVAAGTAAGVATAAVLCTPVGQVGLGCYLGYKLARRGYKFFSKRVAN